MKLEELYPPFATWSLVFFIIAFSLHIVTLIEWIRIPELLFVPFILLIFPFQFILIYGMNGGKLFPKRQPYQFGRSWKYFFVGLKFIPTAVRYFGLTFWYIYAPSTFIVCAVRENGSAFFALGISAFAMVHFLGFRYVLPQRQLIVDTVTQDNAT